MSDSTHTPARWKVNPDFPCEVELPSGKTVASIWHEGHEGREITVTDVSECPKDEAKARARLIAAAPELLEALKMARAEMTNQRYNKPRIGMENTCFVVDAAIAKAEAEGREG